MVGPLGLWDAALPPPPPPNGTAPGGVPAEEQEKAAALEVLLRAAGVDDSGEEEESGAGEDRPTAGTLLTLLRAHTEAFPATKTVWTHPLYSRPTLFPLPESLLSWP